VVLADVKYHNTCFFINLHWKYGWHCPRKLILHHSLLLLLIITQLTVPTEGTKWFCKVVQHCAFTVVCMKSRCLFTHLPP